MKFVILVKREMGWGVKVPCLEFSMEFVLGIIRKDTVLEDGV